MYLNALGLEVVRFDNHAVTHSFESVCVRINAIVEERLREIHLLSHRDLPVQ